ncbi:aminodeoxychorismate/anthranilate synthase component II [Cuneatibacter sp. NSJ-177]|uniref:anthranilate synthase component II n=1 Tax=Cuneatibacter sp. NSJ-177 TaxID=2931401 RepID=UPI001FD0F693|nr:aminodeoxychorismate/anthranilate synthase component II [Cuneatibacter sp. NSJ-177]MCJ7835897.1 aminodeoxychorismate/anthranilate synthase component II [Cuneatibacter sp. NSJ-177]
MYVMVDNYDSFVYNLAVYLECLGGKVTLFRNDKISLEWLESAWVSGMLEGVILSPGPGSPSGCGRSGAVLRRMMGRVPVLGVCLGHQVIGSELGASVKKGDRPMHGKVTWIRNEGLGLFAGLPAKYQVTRYHSLVVSQNQLPDCLAVDAVAEDGAVMAIRHKELPVYGVQFHPEAVLTQYGPELLRNFMNICEEWRENHGNKGDGSEGVLSAGRFV